ncbi:hypothetical protein [Mycobacterium ostraviense]|uniref:Uncharacterized protein n=1 Tax=Mycobacterium ostraviense TaxID=2738409 RepID=A0A163ZII2_9MYCO|nr:hypothetical protein [Mycobacterium ostraviense]KZS61570.1 hypothetical protein A4G28_23555 [Mycobacterium ostraviense]UGT89647.1 hypothetical protein LTS72_14420 [Mycobacterium ostraviense]
MLHGGSANNRKAFRWCADSRAARIEPKWGDVAVVDVMVTAHTYADLYDSDLDRVANALDGLGDRRDCGYMADKPGSRRVAGQTLSCWSDKLDQQGLVQPLIPTPTADNRLSTGTQDEHDGGIDGENVRL